MQLSPANIEELKNLVACANERGEKISTVDLSRLNRVLEHKAEDMTATVEAGATLEAFQKELRRHNQWLPLDPSDSDRLTIAELLSANLNGPRRFGYGTVGDYLIGLKVVLADGRVISSGGKVVKNVAGYDLAKLFIGGHGTLGIIVDATFKLRPLPEMETFVQRQCASLSEAKEAIESVLDSELTPTVFDFHNLSADRALTIVLGFAGTQDEVNWQLSKARELGINTPATLKYNADFWSDKVAAKKISVLPSKITDSIAVVNGPFIARTGNGIIYHRGAASTSGAPLPVNLFKRLKDEFDPKHILPELAL